MNGFISYAHADFAMFEHVRRGLAPVARAFGIDFWHDQNLHTGQDWHPEIQAAIARADVIVALVSYESLYSPYISDHELPAMQARSKASGTPILPVVLNQCLWEYQFGGTQLAPTFGGKLLPVADWKPQRNGYHRACQQTADAITRRYGPPPKGTP
jgi:hypothetical protein